MPVPNKGYSLLFTILQNILLMLKPIQILAFLLSIFALLFIMMLIFSKNELKITENFSLSFPSVNSFFNYKEPDKIDISKIIAITTENPEDSKKNDSKLVEKKQEIPSSIQELEFSDAGKILLYNFFNKMSKTNDVTHILHYGDSQIEGDRITAYLRNKLRKSYGGSGIGLVSASKLVESFSVHQKNEGEWHRYNIFGKQDTSVHHNYYGVMGTFCRFAPVNTSLDSNIYESSVTFTKSKASYQSDRYFHKLKLFYGNAKEPVLAEVFANETPLAFEKLNAGNGVFVQTWELNNPETVKIKFTGTDSPDIYGISLEGSSGVIVDNIPMRGASGTDFTRISYNNFKAMFNKLNVKMVILEYGGNVMPYIDTKQGISSYGNAFASQLNLFKTIAPSIPVIVIGPSDMSIKIEGEFVSYPMLKHLVREMKLQTLKAGYIFWDMYSAMGGESSMIAWVNNKPSLAANDYTHFSPKGAQIIAEKFYMALMKAKDELNKNAENNLENNL